MNADAIDTLPDSRLIAATFARRDEGDVPSATGSILLESVGGLLDAHRRMAARTPTVDASVAWGHAAAVLVAADATLDSVIAIWNESQRLIAAVDREARRILGAPAPWATEHSDSLGAVYLRLAYLHSISFDRLVLDGPEGANRRRLGRAYTDHDDLVHHLTNGTKFLPTALSDPRS
ncbi:hypothetical protein [Nocardia noduli]|uniref:hypothetical protein n=1 Tax=Nocardia noduli TaxID=2815722 RepID=UPI001C242246|nr:hypothetical protein [Nocardia noduli]